MSKKNNTWPALPKVGDKVRATGVTNNLRVGRIYTVTEVRNPYANFSDYHDVRAAHERNPDSTYIHVQGHARGVWLRCFEPVKAATVNRERVVSRDFGPLRIERYYTDPAKYGIGDEVGRAAYVTTTGSGMSLDEMREAAEYFIELANRIESDVDAAAIENADEAEKRENKERMLAEVKKLEEQLAKVRAEAEAL